MFVFTINDIFNVIGIALNIAIIICLLLGGAFKK